jgi:hypothetical protein
MAFGLPAWLAADDDRPDFGPFDWAANGAVGGALATAVLTAYRLPVTDSLPPTAQFWSQYVAGGDPDDHAAPALALHLAYGTAAGSAFGVAFRQLWDRRDDDPRRAYAALALGTLYGLALSAVGERVLLDDLLSATLDDVDSLVFHASHLVYGLSLGSWLAADATVDDVDLR